ncbi:MAG: yehT 2 [Chitinophagaceae bacterium]|nr:yehT 2 [Chitinophagaceae bacterium]
MQVKAVIIDDEQNSIDHLAILLRENCPEVVVVATATSADEGKEIIMAHNPTILFLDIQMPHRSGLDLLKSLNRYAYETIFVTGYRKYALEAIKSKACAYLMKPVDIDELKEAVHDAMLRSGNKQAADNRMQSSQQQQTAESATITLVFVKEVSIIPVREIIRCEAVNRYTRFILVSGEKIISSKAIIEYEELLLRFDFIRCHKSHLVNKVFIKKWVLDEGGYLLLRDGTNVPVSRFKKEELRKKFGTA